MIWGILSSLRKTAWREAHVDSFLTFRRSAYAAPREHCTRPFADVVVLDYAYTNWRYG